jgi:hypothetical protein
MEESVILLQKYELLQVHLQQKCNNDKLEAKILSRITQMSSLNFLIHLPIMHTTNAKAELVK